MLAEAHSCGSKSSTCLLIILMNSFMFYTLLLSTLFLTLPVQLPAQVAIHDGLDLVNEMISLTETLEEDAYKREP